MANGEIPIVVGVTAHRRIRTEDIDLIREKVSDELRKLKEACPDSRLVLLDSIAAGGDSLCALEAVSLGYSLEVPLPFEEEEYMNDFTREERKTYDFLRERAERVFELNSLDELDNRDRGYYSAGEYIVKHSHVLIALWDGVPGVKGGCGTAEMIDLVHRGLDDGAITSTPYLSVIHISAIREGKEGESGVVSLMEAEGQDLAKLLKLTNEFNRDIRNVGGGYPILSEEELAESDPMVVKFHDIYVRADALSMRFRDRYLSTMKMSSVLGVGIVLSLLFYNQIGLRTMLILYALLPLVSKYVVDKRKKEAYLKKYVDYRVLAEGARIQIMLLLSGLDRSVGYLYPWVVRDENEWIIKALMTGMDYVPDGMLPKRYELVQKMIVDQYEYQKGALSKEGTDVAKTKKASNIVSYITYLNYALVFAAEFIDSSFTKTVLFTLGAYSVTVKNMFKITLGILSASAALMNNYYGKLSLSRKVEDHKKYINLYSEVLKRMEPDNNELIIEAAREELRENSAWRSYVKNNSPKVIIK
ncbi:MAG: hypothetical protein IJG64_02735 [Oscillospiraceae bacterium]|nr:hypothetical protein [Oscillospiraceae bacterium]